VAKTTSGFNPDHTVRLYVHGLLLESPFVPHRLLGCMGKNKAKTAVLVAVAAKPEEEIWRRPKNELFDPGFLFAPSDTFSLGRTVSPQYKTSQTDRPQTDGQTTHRAKGTTNSTVGQQKSTCRKRSGYGTVKTARETTSTADPEST